MKTSPLFKCTLLALAFLFTASVVSAQVTDSTIYFFRKAGLSNRLVASLDSADFFRIVPPFNLSDATVEVRDFYKNGKLMFIGNGITKTMNLRSGRCDFEGICITYLPTGKKISIVNYSKGLKAGPEYQFYPDGKIRLTIKNEIDKQYHNNSYGKVMDFYDKAGNQICKDGTGKVIIYNDDYTAIVSGELKDSKMSGAWEGWAQEMDDVKYKIIFKNNQMQSGTGYQTTTGKSYPFKEVSVSATCEKGEISFISKLRQKIKMLRGAAITKSIIDSTKIYFEVETDGKVTHLETLEPVPDELMATIKKAFAEGPKWTPSKMYGMPLRTQVVLSLELNEPKDDKMFNNFKSVKNYQVALYKGIPLGALPTLPKSINE